MKFTPVLITGIVVENEILSVSDAVAKYISTLQRDTALQSRNLIG